MTGFRFSTRARLIGRQLRQAYARKPSKFPLPLNDDAPTTPNAIRRLGIHLIFSASPFELPPLPAAAVAAADSKRSQRDERRVCGGGGNGDPAVFWKQTASYVRQFVAAPDARLQTRDEDGCQQL